MSTSEGNRKPGWCDLEQRGKSWQQVLQGSKSCCGTFLYLRIKGCGVLLPCRDSGVCSWGFLGMNKFGVILVIESTPSSDPVVVCSVGKKKKNKNPNQDIFVTPRTLHCDLLVNVTQNRKNISLVHWLVQCRNWSLFNLNRPLQCPVHCTKKKKNRKRKFCALSKRTFISKQWLPLTGHPSSPPTHSEQSLRLDKWGRRHFVASTLFFF